MVSSGSGQEKWRVLMKLVSTELLDAFSATSQITAGINLVLSVHLRGSC